MIPRQVKIGSRVEIRIVQQVRDEHMPVADKVMYISSIVDMAENEDIIYIYQPTERTRPVNLQSNIRYDFIFITDGTSLYRAEGEFIGYAKEAGRNDIIYNKIKITSPVVKHQRREFYRQVCNIPVIFYEIPSEVALLPEMNSIESALEDGSIEGVKGSLTGTILDISGGGIRFTSNKQMLRGMYGLFEFEIDSGKGKQTIRVVGQLLDSGAPEGSIGIYHNRVSFSFKSNKDRESIVQFVFTEQLRKRNG